MSEAELIEIAQRRRKLEEAIEQVSPFHTLALLNAATDEEKEHIQDLIDELEECAELCRDDMNRMADWIRARSKK